MTNRFEDLALSPDGKKVAFVARGDVFAASTKDASDATRVTTTDADRVAAGVVTRQPSARLRLGAGAAGSSSISSTSRSNTETALTTGDATDLSPVFSPDGKSLAYLRDRQALHVLDLASKQDRVLTTGTLADTVDTPSPSGRRTASGSRSSRSGRRRSATSGWCRSPAAPRAPSAFWPTSSRTRSPGVTTARSCSSTLASAPKAASSQESISRQERQDSAKTCSAICLCRTPRTR